MTSAIERAQATIRDLYTRPVATMADIESAIAALRDAHKDMAAADARYKTLQYVPHAKVESFKAAGWIVVDDLSGTNHGAYSVIMKAPPS